MTGMDGKKDPGKFTVRFNLCDPRQRQVAELLNRQGRSKARFIANAVLCYVGGQASLQQGVPTVDNEQRRSLVVDILSQRQDRSTEKGAIAQTAPMLKDDDTPNEAERRMIIQTLNAFQQQ